MKPLDIVRTPGGGIALITETNDEGGQARISYIRGCNPKHEYNAWWRTNQLTVVDNLPRLLAGAMYNGFGRGQSDVEHFFGSTNTE